MHLFYWFEDTYIFCVLDMKLNKGNKGVDQNFVRDYY